MRERREGAGFTPLIPAAIFLVSALAYTLCLSPNWGAVSEFNTWDGLEYNLCSYALGIDHPPGHPAYLLLSKLAMLWPGVSPSRAINMVSALSGALALVFLYSGLVAVMARQDRRPPLGWCRAAAAALSLGFGFSYVFWSHCGIAEVHTLFIAILAGMIAAAVKWQATGKPVWLNLSALLAALGIGVNLLATLALIPAFTLFVWMVSRGGGRRREFLVAPLLFLAGFLSYLYYPVRLARASFSHPMNLMAPHPFGSADWYRWYISGAAWTGGTMFFLDRIGFNLGLYWRFVRGNLGIPMFLLAIAGTACFAARAIRGRKVSERGLPPAVALGIFLAVLFVFVAGPELSISDPSNPAATDYLANFFLPSLLLMYYWAAIGLAFLLGFISERAGAPSRLPVLVVSAVLLLLYPACQFYRNFRACDLSDRQQAYLEARERVRDLPPDALVLSKLVYPQIAAYFTLVEPLLPAGHLEVVNPDVEAARLAREKTAFGCGALFARKNRDLLSRIESARESGREVLIAGDAVEFDKAPEKMLLADLKFSPRGPFPLVPGAPRELNLYRVDGFRSAVEEQHGRGVTSRGIANDGAFANGIRLRGYSGAPSVRFKHGGLLLDLDLVWEREQTVGEDIYTVVTVLDERMRPVAGTAAWYTLGGRFPPSRWPSGTPVRERVSCLLPPLRPGRYFLALGLLDCNDRKIRYLPARAAVDGRAYEYVLVAPLAVPPPPQPGWHAMGARDK